MLVTTIIGAGGAKLLSSSGVDYSVQNKMMMAQFLKSKNLGKDSLNKLN
jgi:hypothetical protein